MHTYLRRGATAALAGLALFSAQLTPCFAEDATEQTEASANVVGDALKQIKFNSGKPNLKADYYLFVQASKTCPKCIKRVDEINKEYSKIKRGGRVEVIFISHDKSVGDMKSVKAKFPSVLLSAKGVSEIPGFKRRGDVPVVSAVRASDGKEMMYDFQKIKDWPKFTIDKDEK